jgi:hypothetical protein
MGSGVRISEEDNYLLTCLKKALPGEYEIEPDIKSFGYKIIWRGQKPGRISVCKVSDLEFMDMEIVKLAEEIRKRLLNNIIDDPKLIMDLLLGEA